jgi:hypothetical protein
MLTAHIAVENIALGRHDKSNIWDVNVDDEYHEERAGDEAGAGARSTRPGRT